MYQISLRGPFAFALIASAVAFTSSAHQTSRTIECQDMAPYPGCCTAVSPSGGTPPIEYQWSANAGYHDPAVTASNYTHYYCPYLGGNDQQWNVIVGTELQAHGHVTCPTPPY